MDANTARTVNMRLLVQAAGGPAEWSRVYSPLKDDGSLRWPQPQVSQWISDTDPKGIGRKLARDLEAAQHLTAGSLDRYDDDSPPLSSSENAPGYLHLGLLDGVGGMGNGVVNQDFPEVIREMQFSEQRLRSIFGFLPKAGRITLMTGRGHSMEPLISSGDVVMVDTQITRYEDAGPYVINLGDGQQIKTLQNRGGDDIYVVSLNEKIGGPPFLAPKDMIIGGKVYVVQKFVMAH